MKLINNIYNEAKNQINISTWWESNNKIKYILGVILIQNTKWRNALKSIKNLNQLTQLNLKELDKTKISAIEKSISPSGFMKRKANCIKEIANLIINSYESDIKKIFRIKGVN